MTDTFFIILGLSDSIGINVPLKKTDMRSFSGVINDYLCSRSKILKQGDYGKQESDNDRSEIINS